MAYQRILTIQDISCVGQCSLTVALPILSACGHETCVLPTALLSTHTGGFGQPVIVRYDDALTGILGHWQESGIRFDAILTGYLGSSAAVEAAGDAMQRLLAPGGVRIVDPAMADGGRLYSGFDGAYVRAVGTLCRKADILLPNVTEAAMLTGIPYREELDEDYVCQLLDGLDAPCVVLTGVGYQQGKTGVVVREGNRQRYYCHDRIGKSFSGTGDLFAACFTGVYLHGNGRYEAARMAADFTSRCLENTVKNPAHWYGVKFETALPDLIRMLQT